MARAFTRMRNRVLVVKLGDSEVLRLRVPEDAWGRLTADIESWPTLQK